MATDGVKYRLGLDLGTNSIGWAAVKLNENGEPCGILDMGVRIFPDGRNPTDKTSNAVERRVARGARRRRDRYLKRRTSLMQTLVEFGLMPCDEAERKALERLEPYALRARALDHPLEPHELGRALFHLDQRRGFKSNRKSEQRDKDTGPAKEAAKRLDEQLSASKARTLGEFLYLRLQDGDPARFRNLNSGGKAKYEFYPTRPMILNEFDAIWEAQESHHADVMTADAKESLRETIFYQKDPDPQPVGKCTLDPASSKDDDEGLRCPWAHPLAQRFRIWQEVRNLDIQEVGGQRRSISKEEGDIVACDLLKYKAISFDKIRKLLDLPRDAYFNLESQRRKGLLGDQTAAKLSHKDLFGKTWRSLPLDRQIETADRLLNEDDEEHAIEWLTQHAELGREAASRVASAFLLDGHCRLGLRAIRKILPYLEEGMNYPDAAKSAGYDHARTLTGELSPTGRLPYYGEQLKDHLNGSGNPRDPEEKRWGRFPNPSVHIGLGQLRRVVNALIAEYGRPHQVVVEMTRDFKLSKKQRDNLEKEQKANQKKNEERKTALTDLGLDPDNYQNRLKMRLWEELNPTNALDRRCPYTGEAIGLKRLYSADVEIDHLIPWQDSLDDSPANKVVNFRSANRFKGKHTPFETFGKTPEWEGIVQRASKLPPNKRWRFGADAREHFEKQEGFLARQLHETGWLARLSKEYMAAVVTPNNIWVTPGRLTSMIRAKWGLNDLLPGHHSDAKKRTDHRHHTIDALVIGLTDRSLLQRMSSAYDETRAKIKVPPPWEGFDREQVRPFLDRMVVSYKLDHGTPGKQGSTTGQLHNETAYGFVDFEDDPSKVVVRKKLSDFKKRGDIDDVRDTTLRAALLELWDKVHWEGGKAPDFAEKAANEGVLLGGGRRPVRNVRAVENLNVVAIRDRDGRPYKGYKPDSNAFADIWEMRDKSWKIVVVSTFDANQPDFHIEKFRPATARGKHRGKPDPAAKWLIRLHKDDMGALGSGPDRRIVRARQIWSGKVILDDHNEADVDARERKGEMDRRKSGYSAKRLREEGFRKIRVDEIGRIRDPGPPAT